MLSEVIPLASDVCTQSAALHTRKQTSLVSYFWLSSHLCPSTLKYPWPSRCLSIPNAVQRAHHYEKAWVKIKLQLEYIPCKYQENILRHKNVKKRDSSTMRLLEWTAARGTHPPVAATAHTLISSLYVVQYLQERNTSECVSFKYTLLIWEAKELFWVHFYLWRGWNSFRLDADNSNCHQDPWPQCLKIHMCS